MEPSVCEKTIAYGEQRWRVSSSGEWSVMMWGWWPDGGSYPSWRWQHIEKDKIPDKLKGMEKW